MAELWSLIKSCRTYRGPEKTAAIYELLVRRLFCSVPTSKRNLANVVRLAIAFGIRNNLCSTGCNGSLARRLLTWLLILKTASNITAITPLKVESLNRFQRGCCALAFFLSGASALTYEILWQRQMFLIFGASAPATTAILTAIFLGIALGSRLAVPLMKKFRNPFLLYAVTEGVIGVWGFFVPAILKIADGQYVALTASLGEGHPLLYSLRFLLAILSVLPATLAMGATIPVMVRCIGREKETGAAWAYGINILGAVAGCTATGLLFLRWFGIQDTRLVAVALNAVAVVAMLVVGRRQRRPDSETLAPADVELGSHTAVNDPTVRGLSSLYFVAGFVALGFEVVWLRFLGIVNTNSTTTFTLALSVYLLGMGLGSLVIYSIAKKYISPRTLFGLSHGGAALAALICFPVVYYAAQLNYTTIVTPGHAGTLTLADVIRTEATITVWLMLLPAMFMGMTYPAMCDSLSVTGISRDRWIGRSYFWGTLGSVLGILLVAMLIIPTLGLHGTFAALVVTSSALCLVSRVLQLRAMDGETDDEPLGFPLTTAFVCLGMIGTAVWFAKDPQPLMRDGIAKKIDGEWTEFSYSAPDRPLSKIVHFKSGASATVMIRKTPANDHLVYVDDHLVASTNVEAKIDSLMLAHLPLLLHENPKSALTVGFGTGGTSHGLTTHGIDAWCVEIEPEVPRCSYFMPDQNFNILDNPRFSLILNDARDHLHAGQRTYDSIITDVTNLQYKQNGNLYTVEYFDLMKQKLNPRGVACAWIPLSGISKRELQILMKSFQEVYPHATLWFMNHDFSNFGILIGTAEKLQIDYSRLQAGFADQSIADSLAEIGMTHPLQFVHCLHLDEDGYRQFCGDVELHTDDMPVLEFSSVMSFHSVNQTFCDNLSSSLKLRPTDFRPYVKNIPAGMDGEFDKHQTASLSFCRVGLNMYQFFVAQGEDNFPAALEILKQANESAQAGMTAWPEDKTRETFYTKFLSAASRWLQSNAAR